MTVKNTLFDLWQEKEKALGRTITISEVAQAIEASRDTVSRMRSGDTTRFDSSTIDRICKYFDIPAGPIPFLIYTPES